MSKRIILLLIFLVPFSSPVLAAVDIGVGSGARSCRDVSRAIIDEWFTLKNIMSPDSKSLKRPKVSDFQCVSPYYVRDLIPRGTLGQGKLSCFSPDSSAAICCDKRLQICATLGH